MSRRNERWSEQDAALRKARQGFARAVKTPPIEATTGRSYVLVIPGLAQPGGSKQAFVPLNKNSICTCTGKQLFQPYRRPNGGVMANVVDANSKVGRWKKHVARIAHEEYPGPLFDGFLRITFIFFQPRPQSHYTSTGKLSKQGLETPWPNVKPDTTKLVRATEDALLNIVYTDDAIIVKQAAEKEYGTPARVEILIEELTLAAQQDQPALFQVEDDRPPWERESRADDPQKASADRPGLTSAAWKSDGTCDGGTARSDQSGETVAPPPWEAQEQTAVTKVKKSRGKVIA